MNKNKINGIADNTTYDNLSDAMKEEIEATAKKLGITPQEAFNRLQGFNVKKFEQDYDVLEKIKNKK